METKDLPLKQLEIIEPLVHLHPVPWSALRQQAQKAGRSPRTLQRWIKTYKEKGIEGFKRSQTTTEKSKHLDLKSFAQKHYLSPGRLSVAAVHGLCVREARRNQRPVPSYTTVYRYIQKIPKAVKSYHRNRKEFNDKFKVSGDLKQATYPGELYLIDHRQADVLVYENRPRGTPKAKRPWITSVIDHYSRCLVGYYLNFDPPSSRRVALAIRDAILPKDDHRWPMCGIPKAIRHDFGSDLISKHIQQIRMDLKIEWDKKEIANPRGDAIIERFFGTMADWEHQCDGWVGHSLKHRPEKVRPSMTLDQFQQRFYDFVVRYHAKKHSSTEMTPFDRWNNGTLPLLPESIATLDLLLMPVARSYKIRRDGIHFQTNRYWCDELLEWIGETSQLRYDPLRLEEVIVFVGNRRVGTAFRLSGKRQSYATYKKKRQKQNRFMKEFVQSNPRLKADDINTASQDNKMFTSFPKDVSFDHINPDISPAQPIRKSLNPLPIKQDDENWC